MTAHEHHEAAPWTLTDRLKKEGDFMIEREGEPLVFVRARLPQVTASREAASVRAHQIQAFLSDAGAAYADTGETPEEQIARLMRERDSMFEARSAALRELAEAKRDVLRYIVERDKAIDCAERLTRERDGWKDERDRMWRDREATLGDRSDLNAQIAVLRSARDDARADLMSSEHDLARLINAVRGALTLDDVRDVAENAAGNGRAGWVAEALDPATAVPCRVRSNALRHERDAALARVAWLDARQLLTLDVVRAARALRHARDATEIEWAETRVHAAVDVYERAESEGRDAG